MASRLPATVSLSLEEFSRHGGQTGEHKDGWGVAYYHGKDALLIREPHPAAGSACMRFVRSGAFGSTLVMSHIRKATMGAVALRNTQPFARELAGRLHVFAHNGMLPAITTQGETPRRFHPIGETDSEYAFCVLLERLSDIWTNPESPPSLDARMEVVTRFARHIGPMGPANFMYCDSEVLFAHGNRRRHQDGIRPPGLHYLCRKCTSEPEPVELPGLNVVTRADSQDIVLIASVPLSGESWIPLREGEVLLLKDGEILGRS